MSETLAPPSSDQRELLETLLVAEGLDLPATPQIRRRPEGAAAKATKSARATTKTAAAKATHQGHQGHWEGAATKPARETKTAAKAPVTRGSD